MKQKNNFITLHLALFSVERTKTQLDVEGQQRPMYPGRNSLSYTPPMGLLRPVSKCSPKQLCYSLPKEQQDNLSGMGVGSILRKFFHFHQETQSLRGKINSIFNIHLCVGVFRPYPKNSLIVYER